MTRAGRWLRSAPTIRFVALIVLLAVGPTLQVGVATSADAGPLGQLRRLERKARNQERRIEVMERSARRFRHWLDCVSLVPVDEVGDRDHRFGFAYDEVDGTGLDHRPALVRARDAKRSDYQFMHFAFREDCQSHTTRPGTPGQPGTADPARMAAPRGARTRLRRLERLVAGLERRIPSLERMADRFDEWESCTTMLGVTEYGDPDGGFGYHFETPGGAGFMPALAIDISEWDDPDYFFLVFKGKNRPFVRRECQDQDGEEVDRAAREAASAHGASRERRRNFEERLRDVRDEMHSIQEDIEDLWKAVGEFEIFDQCMYTIGVSEFGSAIDGTGYVYRHRHREIRPALAMDVASFRLPRYQFVGYPGEEPPSIECNEDAEPRPPNAQ